MTRNILILLAFILVAATPVWTPLVTDNTITGIGTEDSPLKIDTSKIATRYYSGSLTGGASYDVYTALISQADTDDPVPIVLENTLGGSITWSYDGTGSYIGTLTGAFTADKTAIIFNTPLGFTAAYRSSINTFTILTYDDSFTLANDMLNNTFIEVRVYP